MTNSLVNQYLTRVSHFAGEYVMLIYLREGAENIDGYSEIMLPCIAYNYSMKCAWPEALEGKLIASIGKKSNHFCAEIFQKH